jgi:tRNA-specific 2-thiouridylase
MGQRKGLRISLGYPAYVIDKDIEKNTVIVGNLKDCYKDLVKAYDCNFILIPKIDEEFKARVRYKGEEVEADLLRINNGKVVVKFKNGIFSPCAGQSIVFYKQDTLIGGGIIG